MFELRHFAGSAATLLLMAGFCGLVQAQEGARPTTRNPTEMKFVQFPGMPACSSGSVQSGDPAKGPSIIFAKSPAGCSFPWHWHTPNEHLMMVTGVARVEMIDGKPAMLRPGAFAMMPSHHVHRFTCTKACTLYVYSDAAFDIHYVDNQGREIPSDEALKKTHLPKK